MANTETKFVNVSTEYRPKPIPTKSHDWIATYDGYEEEGYGNIELSMIESGMTVTIEDDDANELRHFAGRRAKVHKVVGAFAIIEIDGIGGRGCITDYLQPIMTAEIMAQRLDPESYAKRHDRWTQEANTEG